MMRPRNHSIRFTSRVGAAGEHSEAGVAGDLMVHLISGMMATLGWNEVPRSAMAMGGIFRFKDGRDMPDFHTVLFDYHGIPVYVRLDLGCETPELARFMGQKGTLDAGEFDLKQSFQSGTDQAPSYYEMHSASQPNCAKRTSKSGTKKTIRNWEGT